MAEALILGDLTTAAHQFIEISRNSGPALREPEVPGAFVFDGERVWAVNADRDIRTMSLETFVGGVAYALVEQEEITPAEATEERVAELSCLIHGLHKSRNMFRAALRRFGV